MIQNLPDSSQYNLLVEKGLMLPEKDFNAIFSAITTGIKEARAYLKAESGSSPQLTFSNTAGTIGYTPKIDSINLRLEYLNLIAPNATPIEYRDQLVCFVPDKFYMIVKYLQWLKLFGIEQTIHYYQKHGNPLLKVTFPDKFPESLSPKSLLLSDLEVEARTIIDAVILSNNESPVWDNINKYLSHSFPEYYNKPIDHLIAIPKPNLFITFEMESIMI